MDWKRSLIGICCVVCAGGCTRTDELIVDPEQVNAWVHRTMTQHYLWSAQMPIMERTDRSLDPEAYFDHEIRYRANDALPYYYDTFGDRFSYLDPIEQSGSRSAEYLATGRDEGFGFESRLFVLPEVVYVVQVIYVVRDAPADKAGLRRGDEFSAIVANGKRYQFPIDRSLYTSLMERETEITLCVDYPHEREITLSRGTYYDSPVLFDTVYATAPRTAYLVYNHFTSGDNDRFLGELNDIFRRFRAQGAEDLILDLRYNPGGELIAARRLASLIARRDMLGKVFVYKETKRSIGNPSAFEAETFLPLLLMGDANMDARKICVITSDMTASASELILHGLKPYYGADLIHVGETTVGKNLGGVKITDKRYLWELHPITIRIYNRDKISGYERGISPDGNEIREFAPLQHISGSFGDWQTDPLLRTALSRITDGVFPVIPSAGSVSGMVPTPPVSDSATDSRSLPAHITTQTTIPQRPLIAN